jgi:hypothetical protein
MGEYWLDGKKHCCKNCAVGLECENKGMSGVADAKLNIKMKPAAEAIPEWIFWGFIGLVAFAIYKKGQS